MDRLDKSLDDLIAAKPRSGEGINNNKSKSSSSRQQQSGGKVKGNDRRVERQQQSQPYRSVSTAIEPIKIVRKPLVITRSVPVQERELSAPVPTANRGNILSRVGGGSGPAPMSGTAVEFSNLNADIRASDIAELCGTVGETKKVEMKYDASGKAVGVAEVRIKLES
jgi:hypothetical protein